ncbi:MAG: hypothetical protein IKQ94_07655 [Bacteroidales bacterium]|nr:hypothetical protein [Bacteroidales bacterium]
MAEQDVLLNGIRRLVKSQCVLAETLTFHRVANPHRVHDFFAFVFSAVFFLGVSDEHEFTEFTRINNSMRKFKPIRKEKEEAIIKTALQVCHDKWRGVSRANDSGSVFAVLSCFFFLSTQKEENT